MQKRAKIVESHWYDIRSWTGESEDEKERNRVLVQYGAGMSGSRTTRLMEQLRGISAGAGVFNYGNVRDLMYHSSILDALTRTMIMSPSAVANDFLKVMMDKGILPAYGNLVEGEQMSPLQHLIASFFSGRHFTGDLLKATKDAVLQQAFS